MEKAIKIEKVIEAIIGLLFCLPAVRGVICFIMNLCTEGERCDIDSLNGAWYGHGDSPVPNTPVYFGLMAIAVAYMLKNSLRYLFLTEEEPKN